MKSVLIILIIALVTTTFNSQAQKKFNLIITVDSSINPKSLSISYYNGYGDTFVPDTFTSNIIKLTDKYISKFLSLNIDGQQGSFSFFINEKKAIINLKTNKKGTETNLECSKTINVIPVFDTVHNILYKKLMLARNAASVELSQLWANNGGAVRNNDSLAEINRMLQKKLDNSTIQVLKKYPNEYFSFWYFRDQIIEPALEFFKNDTAYLKSLLTSFKNIFPPKIIETEEAKNIIANVNFELKPPLGINSNAPSFTLKNNNGKNVQLSDFKGKYILLDFWASWCGPCRRNNPVLKNIYQRYENKSFEIISISIDNNPYSWKSAILEDKLNWVNILDLIGKNDKCALQYGVTAVPHYFLISPDGKIIANAKNDIGIIENELEKIF